MARYFFHLHERSKFLEDFEGQECASQEEAVRLGVTTARDVMMGEMRAGRLNLDWTISITDSSAHEVGRVGFRDAITVSEA